MEMVELAFGAAETLFSFRLPLETLLKARPSALDSQPLPRARRCGGECFMSRG